MSATVHPNRPTNALDFIIKFRASPDAFKRISRIAALAVQTFAGLAALAPLKALAGIATLTCNTINAIQIFNPLGYFFNNEKNKGLVSVDNVINGGNLYLSFCDVVGWMQEHAKDLASYAYRAGTQYPILGKLVTSSITKFVLPAVVITCGADLYLSLSKLSHTNDVVEQTKAKFSIAADVGHIASAVLALAAFTQPLILGGAIALEFTNLFVGLASDGYNVFNPS